MARKKTGRYYHKPGDHFFLKIRSHGDVPRVFSVLIADGVDKDGERDADLKGLVIIDRGSKDHPRDGVAIEYAYADDPELVREAFDRLEKADWPYLVNFLLGQNDDLPKISPSAFYKNVPEIEKILAYDMAMGAALRAGKTFEPSAEYLRLIKAPEPGNFESLLRIATKDKYEPDLRIEEMKADNDNPWTHMPTPG